MALDPDPERDAEVERFLVRQTELAGQFVDPNLLGQVLRQSLLSRSPWGGAPSILACSSTISRSDWIPSSAMARRNALRKADFRTANSRHPASGHPASGPAHSHAPLPGASRSTTTT